VLRARRQHGSSLFFAEINGIDLDKVAQESMAPNLQEPMMIRGDIDGAFVFTSTSCSNLIANRQDPANDYNWFQLRRLRHGPYSNGMMVSRELLTENPEAVAGLVRAVNKATMEASADQDTSVAAVMAYDNLVDADLETRAVGICVNQSDERPRSPRTSAWVTLWTNG